MPLERTITDGILRLAKSRGFWCLKVHGGPFQKSGIPDCLFIKDGRAVFIEVKQPGKKPSPLQEVRIDEIRRIGGAVAEWVTSVDEAEKHLWK
jgi:hypothetical protein